ncbi:MAG: GTP 3',8-cyclase MoaA [Desulfurococcaceae archaeon]|nr:MAG: GTP 3',8-cyclase MoaA [Desulfurococcaceae archaeon]
MIDRFGRPFTIMRISITHDCNFKCFFCHMEGEDPSSKSYLTPEEIGMVAEAASRLGVRRFKITGGEPTIRRDLPEIIKEIKEKGRAEDISMTTNGVLLRNMATKLREAGLDRVNISLHSLDPEKFYQITGTKLMDRVLEGVDAAISAGFKQIKINMVILKNFNEDDVWRLIDFVRGKKIVLQLIELHPVGEGRKIFTRFHTFLDDVEEKLSKISKMRIRKELHNRPIYYLEGGGAVEIVRPVKNPIFCAACTRIRLTADGYLKPCLVRNDNLVSIKEILRMDIDRERKIEMLIEALLIANSRREPSAYWRIGEEFEREVHRYLGNGALADGTRRIRISIPKKPQPNIRFVDMPIPIALNSTATARVNTGYKYKIEDLL